MKKIATLFIVLAMLISFVSPAVIAATTSFGPITVGANITSVFDMSLDLKQNSFSGAPVTSMDFGSLAVITFSNGDVSGLRSLPTSTTGTGAVVVFVSGNTQGVPYTITQTGTPVTSGANSLPAGALNVVPVYRAEDNAGAVLPAGASVGTPGSWVGTKTLYTSGPTGASRTIQAIYSVTDDPAAGATASVPASQPAGAYSGTVTFTTTTT